MTIRSRCRSVALRVPPVEAVAALLVSRDGVDPAVAAIAARAAQSHIGLARRLARDAEARARRSAVLAIAREDPRRRRRGARRRRARRGRAGRGEGGDRGARRRGEGGAAARRWAPRAPRPCRRRLRSQVKQLEDDQKRRATRAQRDVLDRAMVDLLSLYRDVLVVQLGRRRRPRQRRARRDGARARRVEHRRADRAADGRDRVARTRLGGNVAPLLALEAMAIALRPQG